MEKPTKEQFHLAMYSKNNSITFEQSLELYLKEYPEDIKNPIPDPGSKKESKNKKKIKP